MIAVLRILVHCSQQLIHRQFLIVVNQVTQLYFLRTLINFGIRYLNPSELHDCLFSNNSSTILVTGNVCLLTTKFFTPSITNEEYHLRTDLLLLFGLRSQPCFSKADEYISMSESDMECEFQLLKSKRRDLITDKMLVAKSVCMSINLFFSNSCGKELTADVSLAVLSLIMAKATSLSPSKPIDSFNCLTSSSEFFKCSSSD
ncbi:hypothetical protein AGLY_005909 [Aphis glycines]|uniref:Uncharacterized protein n=1 Tax=Aphis glycines TaxID=307491 RepID=A0A6G0TSP9_APHGL|nr:hypothetical protein AGLY_005909 [Aphis glycines]